MNKYIKNYIYAVIRRVDKDRKEEIAKELEANIYDMLGDETSDEAIEKVLKEIGSPIVVAHKYQTNQKHIIHPMFYYDYLATLKVVFIFSIVLSIIVNVVLLFTNSFNPNDVSGGLSDLISEIVNGVGDSILDTFVVVTIGFWILTANMHNPKVQSFFNTFNAKNMLDAPDDLFQKGSTKLNIYLETILGSLFTVFFSVIFIVFYEKLGVYEDGVFITSALNLEYRTILTVLIGFSVTLYVISQAYYAIRLKKDVYYDLIEIFQSVYSIVTALLLMTITNLVNLSFVTYLANLFDKEFGQMHTIVQNSLLGIFAVIIMVSVVQLIVTASKMIKRLKVKTNR